MIKFVRKHKWKLIIGFLLIILMIIFLPIFIIGKNIKGKIFNLEDVPNKRVAIVFGAAVISNKYPSNVLADRIQIAVDLYISGKIEKILMTGGNPQIDHNEPKVMKDYAIALGVPAEVIRLDYAGYRTFDSCARAKKIFLINEAILISQQSHLPRAVFICENFGIKSIGVSADLQEYRNWDKQKMREFIAKIFAFWEVKVFMHDPKFLGEELPI